jgi:hypothetical protein
MHGDIVHRDLRGEVTVAESPLEEVGKVRRHKRGGRMKGKIKVTFGNPTDL